MKFIGLIKLGSISAIASLTAIAFSPVQGMANPVLPSPEATVLVAQTSSLGSGTFIAGEQPTSGTFQIVEADGVRYLEFSPAFSTSDQGPDLHVLLDTVATPPANYTDMQAGRYVNLGALRSPSGTQRYPIPDSLDLSDIQSVVIWCRMANATFGYAPLRPTSAASSPATTPASSPRTVQAIPALW